MSDQPDLKAQRLQLAKNALFSACRFNSEGYTVDEFNKPALKLISHWLIGEDHIELVDNGSGEMVAYSIAAGKGLLLIGGVGTGKTAMMRSVSYARVKGGGSGFVIANAIRIVKEYNQGGDEGGDGVILRYASLPEMCIDDLAREEDGKHYGKVTNVISDIIALRYEHGRPTHFTTNADVQGLIAKYDERTVSRINEMASVLPLAGDDRRATASRQPRKEAPLFMPEPPMPTDEEIEADKARFAQGMAKLKVSLSSLTSKMRLEKTIELGKNPAIEALRQQLSVPPALEDAPSPSKLTA